MLDTVGLPSTVYALYVYCIAILMDCVHWYDTACVRVYVCTYVAVQYCDVNSHSMGVPLHLLFHAQPILLPTLLQSLSSSSSLPLLVDWPSSVYLCWPSLSAAASAVGEGREGHITCHQSESVA